MHILLHERCSMISAKHVTDFYVPKHKEHNNQ